MPFGIYVLAGIATMLLISALTIIGMDVSAAILFGCAVYSALMTITTAIIIAGRS